MEQAPTVWNADEAANQVRAALSGPLQLVADGQNGETLGPWTASVEQIVSLLTTNLVDNDDGTQRYEVSIDMGAFAGFLDTLAPGLLAPPRDGRFHFNTQTGQLEIIQPSVDGRELNVDETLNRLQQAVFRYDTRSVPVAFNYTQPRYNNGVTAAELGITQLVSEGTTYYTGSGVNRRHNIAEGASRFDGIIIGPGEEFSFNYWVGDISEESGFAEGKVIVGGRTVAGVGGGICQVSTTVFRAAFTGGFTIIERNSHAYRVGYYEISNAPGLDAAIWSPERDFRFQNDTPYHLLIETSVFPANNSLQFRFYSTNPGRRIEIDQPIIRDVVPAKETLYEVNPNFTLGQIEQVDYAAEGADITVYRRIYDLGGNLVKEDSIYTHYLPWQAVYDVAPGDSRLS
jgi:vancomycin resistance protein YoaR